MRILGMSPRTFSVRTLVLNDKPPAVIEAAL
jgi:hypothetical protein